MCTLKDKQILIYIQKLYKPVELERLAEMKRRTCVGMKRDVKDAVDRKTRSEMERKMRAGMERKNRVMKRSGNLSDYVPRKISTDTVCHYILHPVIFSTIGKSNDFYLHSLRMFWNDKNLLKDARCQKLLSGLHLKPDDFEKWDFENLERSKDNGWFISSRKNDLAKIGKIAGYFLRRFVCVVGKALDEYFDPEFYSPINIKDLDDVFEELKANNTIVPIIVKVELSALSYFDASRFVCLPEDIVNGITNGNKTLLPRRVNLLEITTDFHDWAWRLLNSPELETRQQLFNILIRDLQVDDEDHSPVTLSENNATEEILYPQIEFINPDNGNAIEDVSLQVGNVSHQDRICCQGERRLASSRLKKRSTKYPSQLFCME